VAAQQREEAKTLGFGMCLVEADESYIYGEVKLTSPKSQKEARPCRGGADFDGPFMQVPRARALRPAPPEPSLTRRGARAHVVFYLSSSIT
jgi:hypothetical protein